MSEKSKEYLEGFLSSAKNILDVDLFGKLHNYARSYAGGKGKSRDDEPTFFEKLSLKGMRPAVLREIPDSEIRSAWMKLNQWFNQAKKRSRTIEDFVNAGVYIVSAMKKRKLEIDKDLEFFKAIEQFTDKSKVTKTDVIRGVGPKNAKIAFVGSSPGRAEGEAGEPFVGECEKILNDLYMKPLGLETKDIYKTNAVPVMLQNKVGRIREPNIDDLIDWNVNLIAELKEAKPKMIIALGSRAEEALGDLADFHLPHPNFIKKLGTPGKLSAAIEKIKGAMNLRIRKEERITRLDIECDPLNKYGNNSVDEVRAYHSLEKLADKDKAMAEIHRVMKPGAKLEFEVMSTKSDDDGIQPDHKSHWNKTAFSFWTEDHLLGDRPRFEVEKIEEIEKEDSIHVRGVLLKPKTWKSAELKVVVLDKNQTGSGDTNYSGGLLLSEDHEFENTKELAGKKYINLSKSISTDLVADIGDIITVEVLKIIPDEAKKQLTWFGARVMDIDKEIDQPFCTKKTLEIAKNKDILQTKAKKEIKMTSDLYILASAMGYDVVTNKSESIDDYTSEMEKFYEKRTKEHIERVIKNMGKCAGFRGLSEKELVARGQNHDASKYEAEEKKPYIWVTEYYRRKNNGESYEYPKSVEPIVRNATGLHVKSNRHHPEFHKSPNGMSTLDIVEMVCDWTAMAQEKQENNGSAKAWADKTVGSKFKFNDEKKNLVYEAIEYVDSQTEKELEFDVINKDNDDSDGKNHIVKITKTDKKLNLFYSVIMPRDEFDSHGDNPPRDEVRKAAHTWFLKKTKPIWLRHRGPAKIEMVESYLSPVDFVMNEQKVFEGDWVGGWHVLDNNLMDKIEKKEYNAVSIGAYAKRQKII